MISRRSVMVSLGALAATAGGASARAPASRLGRLEQENNGQIGVFAFETGARQLLAHRADERFAMCSTFKWLLGALILQEVDAGENRLGRRVIITGARLTGAKLQ